MWKLPMALLGVLLLATPARATTLQVTGGELANILHTTDVCPAPGGNVTGTSGFAVNLCTNNALNPNTLPAGHEAFALTGDVAGFLRPPGYPHNVLFQFSFDPVALANTSTQNPTAPPVIEPFTMTGFVNMIDPSTNAPVIFDLTGQGILTVSYLLDQSTTFGLLSVDFLFTPYAVADRVPEPSTLILIAVGVAMIVGVSVWRRRRIA